MTTQRKNHLGSGTRMLSALVALGGAGTANAIELGEITVQSNLGQPLRASIAYALAPNEELANYCVSATAAAGAFPTVSNTRVSVRNGVITLTGTTPIREPMITTRVSINCPYTPNISREYLMFIDPAGVEEVRSATVVTPPEAAQTTVAPQAEARPERRPATSPPTPVEIGTEYRVQPGDSLSTIAQRISDREMALWPAVNAIFEANPNAFLGGDPNRLKAGAMLAIPQSVGSRVAAVDTAPVFAPNDSASAAGNVESSPADTTQAAAATEPAPLTNLDDLVSAADEAAAVSEAPAAEATAAADDNPYVPVAAQPETTPVIEDVTIESPEESSALAPATNANRSIARVVTPVAETETSRVSPALLWSIGGLGLIAALLVFRRRFRDDGDDSYPAARYAEEDSAIREPTATVEVQAEDFGLDDDSPTDRNLALDASIIVGRDMDGGIDVDFTEAFEGTTELDLDLDMVENEAASAQAAETDIIPPPQIEASSILEQEVMPDDDDYDMSMVVDITKAPDPHEVTARDLRAVEVDADATDNYTMNTQADLEILAQDYQDELSATQALNMEIERAAQQLAEQMDEGTTELSDDDDTGINETLAVDDSQATAVLDREEDTARMEAREDTVEMNRDEDTREMPAQSENEDTVEVMTSDGDHTVEIITRDDDDETVEMEIEGGRFNTRNG